MMTTLKRLSSFHFWAMDCVFLHLETLPVVPPGCLKLVQHLVNAESIWISRIKGEKPNVGVWEERALADCIILHQRSKNLLETILKEEQHLDHVISYVTTNGDPFINNIHDILILILNHGTYHRAQIAKELRVNGIDPISTDYILYVRDH